MPAGFEHSQAPAAAGEQKYTEAHDAVAGPAGNGEVHGRSDHTVAQLAGFGTTPAHSDCTAARPVGTSPGLAVQAATLGAGTKCHCRWSAGFGA